MIAKILFAFLLLAVGGLTEAAAQKQPVYRYPAEWEPHDFIWMGMRSRETEALRATGHRHHHDKVTFPMVKALTPYVPVKVIVEEASGVGGLMSQFDQSGVDTSRVSCVVQSPTSIWYRDIGPIFLTDSQTLRIADFTFSDYWNVAPGAYSERAVRLGTADQDVARQMSLEVTPSQLVMEGGSITVNGKGTVIVSQLTQRRNPHMTRSEIETELKRVLGQQKVIWVEEGPVEDQQEWKQIVENYWGAGSGGHTDEFVAFLDSQTVALNWVDQADRDANPIHAINHRRMLDNYNLLKSATDQDGDTLRVVRIPFPDLNYEEFQLPPDNLAAFREGDPTIQVGDTVRWVAVSSYMNFVITNGVVLLPKYWQPGLSENQRKKDARVLDIFRRTYPDRDIIQINPLTLNHLGGGMHCLVQLQPKLAR